MTNDEIINVIRNKGKIENVTFKDVTFLDFKDLDVNNSILILRNLKFTNCTFVNAIRFINLRFENRVSVQFENCIFKNEVSFIDIISKTLNFNGCVFNNQLTLQNVDCKTSEISFVNNQIGGVLSFNNIECNSLFFSENMIQFCFVNEVKSNFLLLVAIKKGSEIRELNFGKKLEIENIKIESNCTINSIKINDSNTVKLIGRFNEIIVESEVFNEISLQGISENIKETGVIENLIFKNKIFSGNLVISDFTIYNLNFLNLITTNGILSLSNVIIENTFLEKVKISKIYLDLVEFKNQLTIKNSDLYGLKPNNVKWLENKVLTPDLTQKRKKLKRKNINFSTTEDYITELKYQRDVYRQLKIASQNNHNQIDALAFYRNEMRLYWKEIRLVGGISRSNRILVFLNRWMSDFGQNYWLPLMWILIFQTIFSVLIWNFEACAHCGVGTYCENDFWKGLSEYVNWIIPIFKVPDDWSSGAKITSFFMRIFNGFFIYHFIKAIRKYGKGE